MHVLPSICTSYNNIHANIHIYTYMEKITLEKKEKAKKNKKLHKRLYLFRFFYHTFT